ncbi:sensor domain-containing diguanylate cyclase [Gracilinema caldarium]|uniref:diguanylate cyclase n=1 Tax=Gracilinema caldarium (strain ATCC 51460 / DSM 7334 / H1) TaxID=744872 RepID=F8EYC5_GRAC1|nr:GGDEF domain-containing protein [Gracilinema caldarium]AEJ18284.1 diguanylate cyclase [Gracilinema caldarium DSM 7334]
MDTVLRIEINLLCIIILFIAVESLHRASSSRNNQHSLDLRLFLAFIYATIIMLITDLAMWLLDGIPGLAARIGLYTASILYYAFHAMPTSLYILYADYQTNHSEERITKFIGPLVLFNGFIALVALLTPLTGFLFLIDETNRYSRGPGFPVFATLVFSLTLFSFVPVITGRKKTSTRISLTLLAFPLPMVLAAVFQVMFYGTVLIWPTATIFLVTAILNIQRKRSGIDHLTGTANRRSLDETLEHLVKGSMGGKYFGGILIDIDDFKKINDTFGHEAGDKALEEAADILRSAVRQDDFVARYGGDEFVLLLPGAGKQTLIEVSDRLNTLAAAHTARTDRKFRLSFSIGSALYDPAIDTNADSFLTRLDAAMYADKMAHKSAQG